MFRIETSSSAIERRFGKIVVALVALGFLAVLAAGGGALLVMMRGQQHTERVNHTYLVERRVGGIRLSLEEMRSGRRGLLLGLQNSWTIYSEARKRLDQEIAAVERPDPGQSGSAGQRARTAR